MNPIARLCALVLLALVATVSGMSQSEECGMVIDPEDPDYAIDLEQLGGIYITAEDTLRVLLVFVQFPDDDNYHPYWPAHEPPINMGQYIDTSALVNSSNFSNLTNYFRQMSRGLYTVIGKAVFVEAPQNEAKYQGSRLAANMDVLQNAVDPIVDFSKYDYWRRTANYAHQKSPDGVVDMIFMVWRGLRWFLGEASMGGSGNDSISVDGVRIKFGYPVGSGLHCSFPYTHWPEKLLQTMVHELGHWLLGGLHPYGGSPSYAHWSILGQQFNAGVCANAFERERLAWISVPTVPFNENISLGDFIDGGIAYKYQPANAETNEYYWIENHQKLSVYDDATTNPNDKGIWILHQRGVYTNSTRLRIRPSDGFWNWNNPQYSTACFSLNLPVFSKGSVNRTTGRSHRDQLPTTGQPANDWMHDYQDNYGTLHCGGFFRGDPPFLGAFNTTYSSVLSRWSSPATTTWTAQLDTAFAMEVKSQLGSSVTVRFYNSPGGCSAIEATGCYLEQQQWAIWKYPRDVEGKSRARSSLI
jgi:M6 family metalloprotease-like protein